MRTRALLVVALLASSAGLGAQVRRPPLPRVDPRAPAPLPPEAIPVNRDLGYKRLRWSADAYSLVSAMEVPAGAGVVSRYTAFGAGTHGAYRYTDMLSATVDITASPSADRRTWRRPKSERASRHCRGNSTFARSSTSARRTRACTTTSRSATSGQMIPPVVGGSGYANEARYSRGFGGVAGVGVEYSLTRSSALTTEVSAVRSRMTAYDLSGPANIPIGTSYWMTSYRYALGIKFSPVRALRLAQKPYSLGLIHRLSADDGAHDLDVLDLLRRRPCADRRPARRSPRACPRVIDPLIASSCEA